MTSALPRIEETITMYWVEKTDVIRTRKRRDAVQRSLRDQEGQVPLILLELL